MCFMQRENNMCGRLRKEDVRLIEENKLKMAWNEWQKTRLVKQIEVPSGRVRKFVYFIPKTFRSTLMFRGMM